MEIILTNLSNELYEGSRQILNKSATKIGIKTIYSYSFKQIRSSSFYSKNKGILSQSKGVGYWLWKPYIILEALKEAEDGDIVIYADCGIEIISDLKPLLDLCSKETDILLFANSNYQNKTWTKRDCFILMDCDEQKYWDGLHADAAFCLFKKGDESIKFVNEWLMYASNANILTDLPNCCKKENFPEFIEHRSDQSILSLLAIKYNLSLYRMPTQFGNHYKLSEYRLLNELNCINQGNQGQVDYYSTSPFQNSKYFQLLNHHRKKNESTLLQTVNFPRTTKNLGMKRIKSMFKQLLSVRRINENATDLKSSFKKNSYSQCGEDLIVQYVFNLRGITKPTYIDIGANHPFFISNTGIFYEQGCKGINIEANPRLMDEFIKNRPRDINLNIGISDKDGELDFYIMEDNTLSTFSKEECDFMVLNGKRLAEVKKIKLTTISNIIERYAENNFPDFLSIDVEGMDFQILKSIDFTKSFPKIICVEAAAYSPIGAGKRRNELVDYLVSKGYYEYANTNLNAIMVKNEFWFI